MKLEMKKGEEELLQLTDFFKVLGNPTRFMILRMLRQEELCVSELAERLNSSQSAISHQLSILKSNKIVKRYRKGKMIYYKTDDDYLDMIKKKSKNIFSKDYLIKS